MEECDVFSFGCVLIGLICKRLYTKKSLALYDKIDIYSWARDAYIPRYDPRKGIGRSKCSLVHKSLKTDKGFYASDGIKMTRLIVQCVHEDSDVRPTMEEVVQCFLKLRVVRKYADALGLKQILGGRNHVDAKGLKETLRGNILNMLLPQCR